MKIALALCVLLLLPMIWLRGGLFQEPFEAVLTAAQLELFGESWRVIGDGAETIVRADKFKDYVNSLAQGGWRHTEQMGSGYFYVRGRDRAVMSCRQYSTRYKICKARLLSIRNS